MCNLPWTPHSNLEKGNSLKTTPVLAQRWAVWSILTKKAKQLFASKRKSRRRQFSLAQSAIAKQAIVGNESERNDDSPSNGLWQFKIIIISLSENKVLLRASSRRRKND